ncbi:hypothetical protein CORC01_03557 [Colletotrichum orchidophilum]|uniref:Uncharacterized protein n=1 Tax=Colletotrichum orchidophilum TaxID=1209926 RepID=A0A1G4BII1_9PEZI|nr:uncharacterized protein CORC01_03557 [Colletotrichum orchidophilum]OHF01242.1 hypothetical protein CORC01_03557 [Colletotrichum orchidophilum]
MTPADHRLRRWNLLGSGGNAGNVGQAGAQFRNPEPLQARHGNRQAQSGFSLTPLHVVKAIRHSVIKLTVSWRVM